MLNSAAGPQQPVLRAVPCRTPDEELLALIRKADPDLAVRRSTDGTMWIAVELPVPPQHRIYAGFSLLDIARRILGVYDL